MKELRIGFESALAFWRAVRRAGAEPEAMDQGERVFGARDRGIAERVGSARALCGLEGSLDVVVPSASDRINSEHVRNRVWRGPVSERTLVRLGNGVEVFRPAAMLVQLGSVLDEIDLAEVAYELAGTYVVSLLQFSGLIHTTFPVKRGDSAEELLWESFWNYRG